MRTLDLGWNVGTPLALEAKGVLLARCQGSRIANNGGGAVWLLVRVNLDVLEVKVGSRAGVQVHDDALGRVATLDVVPARGGNASTVGPVGAQGTFKVLKVEVVDRGGSAGGVVGTGALVLVVVVLGDEDRRADVESLDVPPGDVLGPTLTTGPALEASSVDGTLHGPVLEEDVGDGVHLAVATQRTDRQAVRGESAVAVLGDDVASTVHDRDAVVTVVAVVAVQGDVLARHVEAVGVEGEARGLITSAVVGSGIDKVVGNLDVGSGDVEAPGNRLDDLDVRDAASGDVERRQLRTEDLFRTKTRRVLLLRTNQVHVGALDVEPWSRVGLENGPEKKRQRSVPGSRAAVRKAHTRLVAGRVDLLLDGGNVVGQVEVAVQLNVHVGEVQPRHGGPGVVSVGLLELDDRIGRAFGESSQNAWRAVLVLSGVWNLAGLFLRGLGGATRGDAADGRSDEEQLGNVDHTGRWKRRRGRERERESGVERERECKSDEAKETCSPQNV